MAYSGEIRHLERRDPNRAFGSSKVHHIADRRYCGSVERTSQHQEPAVDTDGRLRGVRIL